MKPLDCCGWTTDRAVPFSTEWNAGHAAWHWLKFPDSDAQTVAALIADVRERCCPNGQKPCSYHEGFFDALEMAMELRA